MFTGMSREDVEYIKVDNAYGTFKFTASGTDGTDFVIDGYDNVPYNKDLFASLLNVATYTLSKTKVGSSLSDAKLEEYGLTEPKASWTVLSKSGQAYRVFVGDRLLTGGGYYCMVEGRRSVYVLGTEVADTVLVPIESYVTPVVCAGISKDDYYTTDNFTVFKNGELLLRMKLKDKKDQINKNALAENIMVYPTAYIPDSTLYYDIIYSYMGLYADSCYKLGASDADLAAVGTVADMMPLESENRSLVRLGLKNFNHRGLRKLAELSKCSGEMTTTALAMKICPKINSAGRIGNPYVALEVLLMRDRAESASVARLNECNALRQELLEKTVAQANEKLSRLNIADSKIIVLHDEGWKHGILGIAANRFKELYKKPVLMLTADGENLVGSARGTENVNLYEAFGKCKSTLVRFGGHRSSVGCTVKREMLGQLVDELEKGIEFSDIDYAVYYDLEYDEKYLRDEDYSKLALLEPCYPNDKLRFHFKSVCRLSGLFGGSYLKMTLADGLELKGFGNFSGFLPALKCGAEVEGVCNLEYDSYAKKVTGTLVSLSICNSLRLDEVYAANLIRRLEFEPKKKIHLDGALLNSFLKSKNVMLVFNDFLEYENACKEYNLEEFYVDIFRNTTGAQKQIVISPDADVKFYSKTVIFGDFDCPLSFDYGERCVYVSRKTALPSYLETVVIDRKTCMDVYKALKKSPNYFDLRSLFDNAMLFDLSYVQFLLALKVFEELGLIVFDDSGRYKIVENKKVNLEDSVVFGFFGGNEK